MYSLNGKKGQRLRIGWTRECRAWTGMDLDWWMYKYSTVLFFRYVRRLRLSPIARLSIRTICNHDRASSLSSLSPSWVRSRMNRYLAAASSTKHTRGKERVRESFFHRQFVHVRHVTPRNEHPITPFFFFWLLSYREQKIIRKDTGAYDRVFVLQFFKQFLNIAILVKRFAYFKQVH